MNVLINFKSDEKVRQRFYDVAPGWNIRFLDGAPTEEELARADVLMGGFSADMYRMAKNVKWVQTTSAGVDDLIKSKALAEDVAITNVSGAYGQAISECMLGYVMLLYKKFHLYRDSQRECRWVDLGPVRSVTNATVLVVGMGDIGGEFAKLMKKLGAYVIGLRKRDTAKPDYVDELYLQDQLDTLLPRADIVALSLPGTPETFNLFDAERIAKMKDDAILLNVGRGTCIDSMALYEALESGKLSGAAIDVTNPEPLPADHPLWHARNIFITPHTTGQFHLHETYLRITDILVENLSRFYHGQTLKNPVSRELGYRAIK